MIPERGKVPEDSIKSARPKRRNILHDDDSWSKTANQSCHLSPESGSDSELDADAFARRGDVLARKSTTDEVDLREVFDFDLRDVFEDLGFRPAGFEDAARVGVDLDLEDNFGSGDCCFESKVQATAA